MAYPREIGYVLDFSDRTIQQYFEDEFGIDFHHERHAANGTSKFNKLICILEQESPFVAAKILRSLWDRREGIIDERGDNVSNQGEELRKNKFFDIIHIFDGSTDAPKCDGVDQYVRNETLEELVASIHRDMEARKPEIALDRLHTYCVKKFVHLLSIRKIESQKNEALHALFGKYRKELEKQTTLTDFTKNALKSAISLFEQFNHVRNNHSLAHNNDILKPAEARFIFETINSLLIFLRSIEIQRYEE